MRDTKKCNVGSVLLKLFVAAGGFVVANFAGCFALARVNTKKMKEHEDANNLMTTSVFGKRNVEVAEDTQNAYISCLTGGLDITIEKPVHESMYVEIFSALGKVNVYLPAGVNVFCDGIGLFTMIKDDTNLYEDGEVPEIHIVSKGFASKLNLLNEE